MLGGVNRKCRHCVEKCKQFEQVTVVYCPNYKKVPEKSIDLKTGGISTQSKIDESPSKERFFTDRGMG